MSRKCTFFLTLWGRERAFRGKQWRHAVLLLLWVLWRTTTPKGELPPPTGRVETWRYAVCEISFRRISGAKGININDLRRVIGEPSWVCDVSQKYFYHSTNCPYVAFCALKKLGTKNEVKSWCRWSSSQKVGAVERCLSFQLRIPS